MFKLHIRLLLVQVVILEIHTQNVTLSDSQSTKRAVPLFYPFGPADNDNELPPSHDDGDYCLFTLTTVFPYYGRVDSDRICVNTDGSLTLLGTCTSQAGKVISQIWSSAIIGPLVTEINTLLGGKVYFRETTDQGVLDKAKNQVQARFGAEGITFVPVWAFIATWDDVHTPMLETHKFQAVLVTDGIMSFTIFLYASLFDMGGSQAQVGFTAGDNNGVRYLQLPFNPEELMTKSNIEDPGIWVFRVDLNSISDPLLCSLAVNSDCAPNQKNVLGQCDANLVANTPQLADCSPKLIGPKLHADGTSFLFECRVTLNSVSEESLAQAWIDVKFMADDEELLAYSGKCKQLFTAEILLNLPHGLLKGFLNKSIRCEAKTFYDDIGTMSAVVRSSSYWIGVKPTLQTVTIDALDSAPVTIGIESTVPVNCIGMDRECTVPVVLSAANDNTALFLVDGEDVQKRCTYSLHQHHWDDEANVVSNPNQKIYIRGFPRVPNLTDRTVTITLKLDPAYIKAYQNITQNDGEPFWAGISATITVIVKGDTRNFKLRKFETCWLWGDPHPVTFDKRETNHLESYTSYEDGQHIATRSSDSRKFEVLTQQRRYGGRIATVCGVLVREGNYAYELTLCRSNSLRYIRMSDTALPYSPFTKNGLNQWRITMPSGSYVLVKDHSWYMELYIYIPWRDQFKTGGLCGMFDGDPDNELITREGTLVDWPSGTPVTWEPTDFINSWSLESYPDENIFENCLSSDAGFPRHLEEGEYCACFGEYQQCGWDALHHNLQGGSQFTAVPINDIEQPLCGGQPYQARATNSRYESEFNIQPSRMMNISWEDAVNHCESHLTGSTSHTRCSGTLSTGQVSSIVEICATDIQLTGELSWAINTVDQLQESCRDQIFNDSVGLTESEILADLTAVTKDLCLNDCNNNGICQNSVCVCNAGFIGSDCGLTENTQPVLTHHLDNQICDIRADPVGCSYSKILATDVSNTVTCALEIDQVGGSSHTSYVEGIQFTSAEVRCPLPSLADMTSAPTVLPAYKYTVTISNNNLTFSATVPGSIPHVVYDSLCLNCDQNAVCTKIADTCLIQTQCYGSQEIHPQDSCLQCLPGQSTDSWLPLETNQAPEVLDTTVLHPNGTDHVTNIRARDPEGHAITFSLIDPASHPDITLLSNGTLLLAATENIGSQSIQIQVLDQCGASYQTDILVLVACPAVVCSNRGSCLFEDGIPVCSCDESFTGMNCERLLSPGEWSPWDATPCTKPCDYGTYSQSRSCLREPCQGAATETYVCSEFNCEEVAEEKEEGVNMTVHDQLVQEFALKSDLLESSASVAVDVYCTDNAQSCCAGMGFDEEEMIWTPGVASAIIARSYPRQIQGSPDTRVKLLVRLERSVAESICTGNTMTSLVLPVSELTNQTQVYMEPVVLYAALLAGEQDIEQTLGLVLSLEEPPESSPDGMKPWVIGLIVGAVCAVIIIIVISVTVTTMKKNRERRSKVSHLSPDLTELK